MQKFPDYSKVRLVQDSVETVDDDLILVVMGWRPASQLNRNPQAMIEAVDSDGAISGYLWIDEGELELIEDPASPSDTAADQFTGQDLGALMADAESPQTASLLKHSIPGATIEDMNADGWLQCSEVLDTTPALIELVDQLGDRDYDVNVVRTAAGWVIFNRLKPDPVGVIAGSLPEQDARVL